jgi:hypothetical protein
VHAAHDGVVRIATAAAGRTDTGVAKIGFVVTAGRGRSRPPDTVSGPTPAGQASPCSAQISRIRRRFRSAVATDRPSLAAISAFVCPSIAQTAT